LTYQIVELEVSMHNGIPLPRQVGLNIVQDFIVFLMRSAQGFPSRDIFDSSLLRLDAAPSAAVAVIEIGLLAITFQANFVWI
jgi:hypothetical protein